jgi:hypothetical protein
MGLITGAKILTSASPTMNSPTVTNLTTTTLTASGTDTGYFLQRILYPATTSTVFLNSACTANSLIWLQSLGFSPNTISKGGSCMPYVPVGAATAGSFTVSAALATSSVLPMDVLIVNY